MLASHLATPADTRATDAVVAPPCTEAAFDAALATVEGSRGGTITFACGGSSAIIFSGPKYILSTVTIDGGGLVTLSGGCGFRPS
jgi:hypothetical protein